MVARLNFSIYGTRNAAQNWTAEYTGFLTLIGFATGVASTCSFWRKERELHFSVHGDDFTKTGPEKELVWFETLMKNTLQNQDAARFCPLQGTDLFKQF